MKLSILRVLVLAFCLLGYEPAVKGQLIDVVTSLPQFIFGNVETTVLGVINKLCSYYLAIISNKYPAVPDVTEITFQLKTPCYYENFSLNEIQNILKSKNFDPNKPLVVFVSGWLIATDNEMIKLVEKAYLCRNDSNFVVADTAEYIQKLYIKSALNTVGIGKTITDALLKLVKISPMLKIHLIGHSLGAQIVGSAGRYYFIETGEKITRITGLDPANPCFSSDKPIQVINKDDAIFVDIIHTNAGGFGKAEPLGVVDFYVGGLNPIQPNCFKLLCSHERSIAYYAESVYPGNEESFMAVPCASMVEVQLGKCSGGAIPMGHSVTQTATGLYYLNVNSEEPYGKNSSKNAFTSTSECYSCKK